MTPHSERAAPVRVVAIDDDHVVIAALRDILTDEGFDVVGMAHDAAGGVELAIRMQPDIALVDLTMPGGGLSAIREIRATCAHTCVVVLSAHDWTTVRTDATLAGADRYLVKGVDDVIDELGALVRSRDAAVRWAR